MTKCGLLTKLGVLLIAAAAACKSREPPPPATDHTGSQVARAPATGSAAAAPGESPSAATIDAAGRNLTGLRPHQAANCPSWLQGTSTRLAMTPRGVDVTVTSKNPTVVRGIAALAELHVRGRTADVPRAHDQKHGGSGRVGYCPIVVNDDTTVTDTPLDDGVTFHVEARSPDRVPALQELIKARAVRVPGYLSS